MGGGANLLFHTQPDCRVILAVGRILFFPLPQMDEFPVAEPLWRAAVLLKGFNVQYTCGVHRYLYQTLVWQLTRCNNSHTLPPPPQTPRYFHVVGGALHIPHTLPVISINSEIPRYYKFTFPFLPLYVFFQPLPVFPPPVPWSERAT